MSPRQHSRRQAGHRQVNKRTGAIAGASAAAIAAAAFLLPNAHASTDTTPTLRTFSAPSAARLAATLKSDLGDKAAGWYLDGKTGHLVMNVLSKEEADRVTAKGAVAKVVRHSMAALEQGTQTLRATASVPGTAWSIDPRTNRIVVLADRTVTGRKMATLAKATGQMGEMVTVKRSAGEFRRYDGGDAGAGAGMDGGGNGAGNGAGNGGADAGSGTGGDSGAGTGGNGGMGGNGGAGIGGDSGSGTGGDASAGAGGDASAGAGGDASAGAGGDASAGAGGDASAGAGGDASAGAGGDAGAGGQQGGGGGQSGATPAGGDAIFGGNARCSLGFNVTVQGAPAFLTAGHCGNDSKTWSAQQGGQQLGTVKDSKFPKTDFALVTYDDATAKPQSAVTLGNGKTQPITKAAEAAVGMKVQRSGSTTGVHDGTVTGLDATVNYGNGDIVNGLIQTDVCAEPGDSGGSMFSGDSAVGLTSGGSGDCTKGGETFFQPVTKALEATGAKLGAGN